MKTLHSLLLATTLALSFIATSAASAASAPAASHAGDHAPHSDVDMTQFSLFNPVPDDQMRRYRPDNPLRTRNAFTTDPGHLAVEAELFEYVYHEDHGHKEREFAYGLVNIKLGLTHWLDVQAFIPSFIRINEDDGHGHREKHDGIGDVKLQAKINLWGNDGGKTAVALVPFIVLPTGANHIGHGETEYGLLIPATFDLGHHVSFRFMTGVQTLTSGSDREASFVNSAALIFPIVSRLEGYGEFWTEANTVPNSDWQGTAGAGLIYEITHNTHLDVGVAFAVTDSAPDHRLSFGLNLRF